MDDDQLIASLRQQIEALRYYRSQDALVMAHLKSITREICCAWDVTLSDALDVKQYPEVLERLKRAFLVAREVL